MQHGIITTRNLELLIHNARHIDHFNTNMLRASYTGSLLLNDPRTSSATCSKRYRSRSPLLHVLTHVVFPLHPLAQSLHHLIHYSVDSSPNLHGAIQFDHDLLTPCAWLALVCCAHPSAHQDSSTHLSPFPLFTAGAGALRSTVARCTIPVASVADGDIGTNLKFPPETHS